MVIDVPWSGSGETRSASAAWSGSAVSRSRFAEAKSDSNGEEGSAGLEEI